MSAASVTVLLKIADFSTSERVVFCFFPPQARQILEREYNNLLALGTDRRLDEVSERPSTTEVKRHDGHFIACSTTFTNLIHIVDG